uniref:G-protein coupled receptors family 1 profile domain-containing protein n=1 Tax=Cyprinus carpio carpio TaxID=630221 RepID=A0A9J7XHV9_CYPCA
MVTDPKCNASHNIVLITGSSLPESRRYFSIYHGPERFCKWDSGIWNLPTWKGSGAVHVPDGLLAVLHHLISCKLSFPVRVLMKKGNNLAVYLINLSVGDLLYILTLPVWIVMARTIQCSVIAVVMFNSFYMGSGFLCCISVDRYLAIVFPLHFACVREVRTTVLLSVIIWLAVIVLHVSLFTYTETIWNFCASRMCEEPMIMTATAANVAIRRAALGFLVPYGVIF